MGGSSVGTFLGLLLGRLQGEAGEGRLLPPRTDWHLQRRERAQLLWGKPKHHLQNSPRKEEENMERRTQPEARNSQRSRARTRVALGAFCCVVAGGCFATA